MLQSLDGFRWFRTGFFPIATVVLLAHTPPFLDTFLRSYGKSMQIISIISEPADSIMGECSGSNNISW